MKSTTTPDRDVGSSDSSAPCQATPREELLRQLLDSRIPKNEREWCAAREIEDMRADMNDVCITLNSAIEDCEDYAMLNTQQKLTAVRDVLLSYLPNAEPIHGEKDA